MGEKDEFYEFMRKLAREKELRQKDREFIESASRPKKQDILMNKKKLLEGKGEAIRHIRLKVKRLLFYWY